MEKMNSNYNCCKECVEDKGERTNDLTSSLMKYVLVIAFLAVINWVACPNYWWVLWVAGGWGIGLFFKALSVFCEEFNGNRR